MPVLCESEIDGLLDDIDCLNELAKFNIGSGKDRLPNVVVVGVDRRGNVVPQPPKPSNVFTVFKSVLPQVSYLLSTLVVLSKE